ncbi:subtilisin-like protease SBT5.3 [Mercurialis annua]|uniref:subtilisin-like protease SBT5.3 n=1 Tax=Mercurialis annua TaxID=3986 RepID=UPI00215FC9C6|nr:subtilisin-like protease SBT5.3 [Mercurialis annua]
MRIFYFILPLLFLLQSPIEAARKSYVVYLGGHSHGSQLSSTLDHATAVANSHYELLGSCMTIKEKAREAIFYSYTNSINGFAAVLDDEEVEKISKHPEVVSIFPSEVKYELDTTRSWEFLGLERNGEVLAHSLWPKARFGEDAIVANLDSGVWPESESFNDEGMGPIPSNWKGQCDTKNGFKCNKKLIGARYFSKGFEASGIALNSSEIDARDRDGHGTHTLSTAGGRFVPGANLLGSANGTAKGGAPNARVASYKVCWRGCDSADILAGFDAAIHDGVDIINLSLSSRPSPYAEDAISVGSFHAVSNGILVVASAGNQGEGEGGRVRNVAPWMLTVGAGTIDRNFTSDTTLGNKKKIKGSLSFHTNTLPAKKYYPLVYALDAKAANASSDEAQSCAHGSLEPSKVKGKIVYCASNFVSDIDKSFVVSQAGGIGVIIARSEFADDFEPHFVPTSVVFEDDGQRILSYINSTKSPVAYISGGTVYGKDAAPAPVVAAFSSTGPSRITREILKPDILAPGVNILAAFVQNKGPVTANNYEDHRHVPFTILFGTSMAAPHVAGIAGLLKTLHPDWSPSAIKSAIMTTARTRDNVRKPIFAEENFKAGPFSYGSGHIMPNRAMDPGLVYDLSTKDYLNFLCSLGNNKTEMSVFDKSYKCPSTNISLLDFNYPTITLPDLLDNVTVTRTLKNVGTPGVYKVRIQMPKGLSIKVDPTSLKFTKMYEKKTFKVTIKREGLETHSSAFGRLIWSDGVHSVRSPVTVF